MTKLYTLEDISAFSSDAVYKIGLSLEQYGLTQEDIFTFEDYDSIFSKALLDLEDADHVIIAVETNEYNVVKRDILGRFIIEETSCEEIEEAITINAGDDVSEIDMSGHCMMPVSAQVHMTPDGLYSGFTTDVLSGKLTLIPLDFMRIDSVLESLSMNVMIKLKAIENGESLMIQMPDYDFVPCVSAMVSSLNSSGKKIALATSEATMWVYNLYDKIENLTQVVNFVEIIDQDGDEEETTAESESVKVIRHAKEAMNNTDSDFGGAVSEIYSTENDEGKTVYFAYAAVADRHVAKAKKINTMNPDDLSIVLPHAVSVLTQIVCQKNDESSKAEQLEPVQSAPAEPVKEEKKLSKGMMAFAVVVFALAIILPILFVTGSGNKEETTSAVSVVGTAPSSEISESSTQPSSGMFTPDNNPSGIKNNVTEPTVTDVSATPTTTQFSSTSGTFNFYVFGYGHGVGMSQVGADYLAKQGWSWAEILAHYYYDPDTSIVTGDTYPEKIKYEGVEYDTREYLAHSLQAEMGPSFHHEALKAQAVALYTFAKYNNFNLDSGDNAFTNDTPGDECYLAVDEIMENGVYVSNGGQVACTPFHAMSAGVTTSNQNVWGQSVSYLSGGRKSYGDYLDSDFKSVVPISSEELKSIISQKTGTTPSGDPANWISIVTHDACVREDIGYVSTINVNGKLYSGYDFRGKIMSGRLRSHCFTIEYIPDAVTTTASSVTP